MNNKERRNKGEVAVVTARQMLYNAARKRTGVESTFLEKKGDGVCADDIRQALRDVIDDQGAFLFVGMHEDSLKQDWSPLRGSSEGRMHIESLLGSDGAPPEALLALGARALFVVDDMLRRLAQDFIGHFSEKYLAEYRGLDMDDRELERVAYFSAWNSVFKFLDNMWKHERDEDKYLQKDVPPVPYMLYEVRKQHREWFTNAARQALFDDSTKGMLRMKADELKNDFNMEVP